MTWCVLIFLYGPVLPASFPTTVPVPVTPCDTELHALPSTRHVACASIAFLILVHLLGNFSWTHLFVPPPPMQISLSHPHVMLTSLVCRWVSNPSPYTCWGKELSYVCLFIATNKEYILIQCYWLEYVFIDLLAVTILNYKLRKTIVISQLDPALQICPLPLNTWQMTTGDVFFLENVFMNDLLRADLIINLGFLIFRLTL